MESLVCSALCFITHCVDPFYIPLNSSLEESTTNWTRINTNKEYRCTNMRNGEHTQFFEYDRTKSSFSMRCFPDGTFDFVNETQHWPVCLKGKEESLNLLFLKNCFSIDIECEKLPPSIPTDPEYVDPSDDGHVVIQKINYTSGDHIDSTYRSDRKNTELPRNYMANLT